MLQELAIALATIAFTGGVLFLGTYRRGGTEAIRANARTLLLIFAASTVFALTLAGLSANGADALRILTTETIVVTVGLAVFLLLRSRRHG